MRILAVRMLMLIMNKRGPCAFYADAYHAMCFLLFTCNQLSLDRTPAAYDEKEGAMCFLLFTCDQLSVVQHPSSICLESNIVLTLYI